MRILHVVPSFGFGGMEKIICAVINSSDYRDSHGVLVLDGAARAQDWISNSGVSIIRCKKHKSRRIFFMSLLRVLRETQPDLLMSYNWGAIDAVWLGRLAGISSIVHHEHGFNVEESISTEWHRDVSRFILYRLASKVVVVSHEMESMLESRFRIPKRKIKRIPNGIDTSLYAFDEAERKQVRNSLGYKGTDFVIGFSGRLDAVKNLDLLSEIFRRCNPHCSPFRLLIVGDGPERSRLEALAKSTGIEKYVTFVGARTEVLPYLRAMDAFLLTSVREQMPLTVLEAMAVGLPVISTRVGELPYMIEEGVSGFLRDANTPPEEFVELLRSLQCPSVHGRFGKAARSRASERFQIKTMLVHYSDLIREVDTFSTGAS